MKWRKSTLKPEQQEDPASITLGLRIKIPSNLPCSLLATFSFPPIPKMCLCTHAFIVWHHGEQLILFLIKFHLHQGISLSIFQRLGQRLLLETINEQWIWQIRRRVITKSVESWEKWGDWGPPPPWPCNKPWPCTGLKIKHLHNTRRGSPNHSRPIRF